MVLESALHFLPLLPLFVSLGDYSHCLEWCRRAIAGGSRSARPIVLADRIFEEIPFIIEMYPAAYRIWEDVLQTCNISPEVRSLRFLPLDNIFLRIIELLFTKRLASAKCVCSFYIYIYI